MGDHNSKEVEETDKVVVEVSKQEHKFKSTLKSFDGEHVEKKDKKKHEYPCHENL